jgi:hypothetical protein
MAALARGADHAAARHAVTTTTMQMRILFTGLQTADACFLPRRRSTPSVS